MIDSILADREFVVDILKYGTMFTITRMINIGSIFDQEWLIYIIYFITGISIYHLITKKIIKNNFKNEIYRKLTKTWLKMGTILLFSKLLSGNQLNKEWIISSICIIIAFNLADIISYFIPYDYIENKNIRICTIDTVEISIISFFSSYLIGKEINIKWFQITLYTIIGFIFYDLYTSQILN